MRFKPSGNEREQEGDPWIKESNEIDDNEEDAESFPNSRRPNTWTQQLSFWSTCDPVRRVTSAQRGQRRSVSR